MSEKTPAPLISHSGGPFPLIRPDVCLLEFEQSTVIFGRDLHISVRNGDAYQLCEQLLRLSDGKRSLNTVLLSIDPGLRPLAEKILAHLHRKGGVLMIRSPLNFEAALQPAPLWLSCLLSQLLSDVEGGLQKIAAAEFLIVGRKQWSDKVQTALTAAWSGLPTTIINLSHGQPPRPRLLSKFDFVIVDADGLGQSLSNQLQLALVEAGTRHAVVGHIKHELVLTFSRPDSPTCWGCLSERHSGYKNSHRGSGPSDLIVGLLVQRILSETAGAEPGPPIISYNSESGRSFGMKRHLWHAHSCRHLPTRIRSSDGCNGGANPLEQTHNRLRRNFYRYPFSGELDEENSRIMELLAAWTDPLTGPFEVIDYDQTSHLPLGTAYAKLSLGGEQIECSVKAPSSRESVYQAALNAVELLMMERDISGGQVGAGWSKDEALYRLAARAALAKPSPPNSALPAPEGSHEECQETAEFLTRVCFPGFDHLRWATVLDSSGFTRAKLLSGRPDVFPEGVGLCVDEAISNAILCSQSSHIAEATGLNLVLTSPHGQSWEDVWSTIRRPKPIKWICSEVEFAQGGLHIVTFD